MKKILICCLIFTSHILIAHPHIFFENSFKLENSSKNTINLKLELILDDLNSELAKESSENLHFYNDISQDLKFYYNGKILQNNIISKNMRYKDNNLIIDLEFSYISPLKKGDKIQLTIYDKEYFYDYDYDKDSLKIDFSHNNFKLTFKEDKTQPYYYNMVYPKVYEVDIDEK